MQAKKTGTTYEGSPEKGQYRREITLIFKLCT
ncbi:MAG: hypothetical protein ACI88A_000515 [Paraglaciecola sp.]|jgi:hypothetical protein